MYRDNFAEYDIQLLAGSHFDEWMVGAGWSGYFRDAGFKGEISYFQPKSSSSTEKISLQPVWVLIICCLTQCI